MTPLSRIDVKAPKDKINKAIWLFWKGLNTHEIGESLSLPESVVYSILAKWRG